MTGIELLISLFELARRIDGENMMKPRSDLICDMVTDILTFDAQLLASDAELSIEDFMNDLGDRYNAARLYIARDTLYAFDNYVVYEMLCREGNCFETLPAFERYKHNAEMPFMNAGYVKGNIPAERHLYKRHREEHSGDGPNNEFAAELYVDYGELRDRFIECIPGFRLRMKLDPQTHRLVFSAEVESVFDIAWYALARMLSEESPPGEKSKPEERPEGIMRCCYSLRALFYTERKTPAVLRQD